MAQLLAEYFVDPLGDVVTAAGADTVICRRSASYLS
jgi:hypothetical protein